MATPRAARTDIASPFAFGLASVLSDIKRERRLSQLDITKMTGFTQSQVSRWLSGSQDIKAADFVTLCTALGLDMAEVSRLARQRAHDYELRTSVAESTTPGDE